MGFEHDKSFGDIEFEYHILKSCGFNEIPAFVEQFFREKDLTFCLLELVFLKEQGIGRTYIFGKKNRELEDFYGEYYEIVKKFKKDFKGGISSYNEWYSREGAWYVIGKSDKEISGYNRIQYKWHPDKIDPRDIEKYGSNSNELKDSFIQDYLNKYEEEFINLEFKNHPYYGIIVKPLGSLDSYSLEVKPLGNLYLHFATVKKIDKDFLKTFLKDFLLIWYKNYGGLLIEKTEQRLLEKLNEINSEADYLPNTPFGDGNKKNLIVQRYVKTIYTKEKYHNELKKQLECIKKQFIPILLSYRNIFRQDKKPEDLEFLIKFMSGKLGQDFAEKSSSLSTGIFIEVTIQRHITLLKIILFGFKPIDVHNFLNTGKNYPVEIAEGIKDTQTNRNSAYHWFRKHLYMSVTKDVTKLSSGIETTDIKKVQKKLYHKATDREKVFLKQCLQEVKTYINTLPQEDIHKAIEKFKENCCEKLHFDI